MAKSVGNPLTFGLSGAIGTLVVFRQTKYGTVVGKYPRKVANDSEAQLEQQTKFTEAATWAKEHMTDEEVLKIAKNKGITGYNAAMLKYLKEH